MGKFCLQMTVAFTLFAFCVSAEDVVRRAKVSVAATQINAPVMENSVRSEKKRRQQTNMAIEAHGFTFDDVPMQAGIDTATKLAVELSRMMPSSRRARCPNDEVAHTQEVTFCPGMLRSAEEHQDCLVYNFGVAKEDAVLTYLAKEYKGCQFFAFDPTVSEKTWASKGGSKRVFGQNVEFFPWGLYGGQGSRIMKWTHPIYGNVTGELRTLSEIMHSLGHTHKRIAMLRSDCEGCEWGWISTQMQEDPTLFNRIDQLFTELHFASTLRMDDAAMQQVPVVHQMLDENFDVLRSRVNPGYVRDQNKVPKILVDAGADPSPCCREFALINKRAF